MALDRSDRVNCRIKKPPALQRQKACATSFPIRRAGQREHTRGDGHGRGPSTIANNRFPPWANSKLPEVALRAPLSLETIERRYQEEKYTLTFLH